MPMESKFVRVVGGVTDDEKKVEKARDEIVEDFFNHRESLSAEQERELKRFEYPKSETELLLIDFANQEISRLMQEAGMEPYSVPAENIYILPPALYKEFVGNRRSEAPAVAAITRQVIAVNAEYLRNDPVSFGATLLHEFLHLKAHLSMEAREIEAEEEGEIVTKMVKTVYRGGVRVYSSQKKNREGKGHEHFAGLDEAIVAETEKRLLGKMLNLPVLQKEKEWLMSDEAQEMKKKLAEEIGILEDDIIWVDQGGDWKVIAYPQQRQVLNYICAEIQKEFPDQFQSLDDIYKVFLNAHFTGRFLEINKLIDKVFGEGSFRALGNMGADDESGILHLESMKSLRRRQLHQRKEASS